MGIGGTLIVGSNAPGNNILNVDSGATLSGNALTIGANRGNNSVTNAGTSTFTTVLVGNARTNTGATNSITQIGGTFTGTSLQLGASPATTNGSNVINTVNITGGLMQINGNTTIGGTANTPSGANTISLGGGTLVITGTLQPGSVANQTNSFVWTGGTLSVGTITASNSFWTGVSGNSITNNTLYNSAGNLLVGNSTNGYAGRTAITGHYAQSGTGTTTLNILGSTQTNSWTGGTTNYSLLAVSGTAAFGGTVALNMTNFDLATNAAAILTNATFASSSSSLTNATLAAVSANGIRGSTTSGGFTNFSFLNTNGFGAYRLLSTSTNLTFSYATNSYSSGNWGSGGSGAWSLGIDPNSSNAVAFFGGAGPSTVTMDSNRTVGGLFITNSGGLVLTNDGSTTLTLAQSSVLGSTALVRNTGGNQTIAVPLLLGTTMEVTNSGTQTLTLSGSISGTGGLLINSNGATLLTGAVSASGQHTVNSGGVLTVTNGGSLANGAIAVNGTLNLGSSANSAPGLLSGNGVIRQSGGGTLTLASGANTFGGTNLLQAGALVVGGTSSLNSATVSQSGGALTVNSGGSIGALTLSSGTATILGTAANVTASGGTLSGTGSLTSATLNSGSTVNISNGSAAGTLQVGSLTITGGNFLWNLYGSTADSINVAGGVTFSGPQTITITNAVGAGWDATVSTNYTILTASNYSGFNSANFTVTPGNAGSIGTWTLSNSISSGLVLNYVVNATTISITSSQPGLLQSVATNTVFANVGTSPVPLEMSGTGEYVLNMSNTYTGPTTIGSGTLTAQNNASFGNSTGINLGTSSNGSSNAVVNINTTGVTVTPVVTVQGTGGNLIQNSSGGEVTYSGIILQTNATLANVSTNGGSVNGNLIVSGVVSGGGALTITPGSGTVTLSENNSYQGGSTLNGGTLAVSNSSALGTGTLSVASGATLRASNSVNLANNVSVSNGSTTLTLDAAGNNLTNSGNISGSGAISASSIGGGTVTLSGSNSYGGASTVNSGTLALGSSNALPSATTVTVGGTGVLNLNGNNASVAALSDGGVSTGAITNSAAASTLTVNGSTASAFAGNIGGALGLTKSGTGTLTLSGSNGYTGQTALNGGILALGSANALAGTGTISFAGGTLRFGPSNSVDYSSRFSTNAGQLYSLDLNGRNVTLGSALTSTGGSLTLTNSGGAGTLTITSAGTYTGGTLIASGSTLALGSGSAGSLGAGNVTNNGSLVMNFGGGTNSNTISGSGSLLITNSGSPALTLSGSNSFSGGLTVNGTRLQITNDFALGTNNGAVALNGSTIQTVTTNVTLGAGRVITLGGSGGFLRVSSSRTLTALSQITGSAGLGIAMDTGTLVLAGSNNYSGGTTLGATNAPGGWSAGSLAVTLSNSAALGTGNDLTFVASTNAITLGLNSFNASVGALNGDTNATIRNGLSGTSTLTVSNSGTSSYSGVLTNGSGTLALAFNGNGTQSLGGSNSFTGGLTLNSGTLVVSNAFALGATNNAVTLNGGLLDLSGNSVGVGAFAGTSGTLTNSGAASIFTVGNGNGTGTFAGRITGSQLALVKNGTGTVTLSGNNDFAGGVTVTAGTLALGSASALGTGTLTMSAGSLNETAASDLTITNAFNLASFTYVGSGNLIQTNGAVTLLSNSTITVSSNNLTLGGNVADSGANRSLSKAGAGTLILSGSNSYTGGTTITAGTLGLGSADALGSAGSIVFGGGTLRYGPLNAVDYSSRFTTTNSQTYNVNLNGQNVTFGTGFGGTGGNLTVSDSAGGGTLTLAASNAYTGTTTLSGGTLVATNSTNALRGALSMSGNSTLLLGANQNIAGSITGGSGTNLITGKDQTLTLNGNYGITVSATGGTTNSLIISNTSVTVTNTTNNNTAVGTWNGSGVNRLEIIDGASLVIASTGVTGSGRFYIGMNNNSVANPNASTNTVVVNGGSFSVTNTTIGVQWGYNHSNSFTRNEFIVTNSGTVTSPRIAMNNGGSNNIAMLTISSGSWTGTTTTLLGQIASLAPAFNSLSQISNSGGLLGLGTVTFGNAAPTANVNGQTNNFVMGGGTTTVSYFANAYTNGTYTNMISWNGGVLQAAISTNAFLTAMSNSSVTIGEKGAIFDVNGFNNTISANLAGSGTGTNSLTVRSTPGGGVLTLSGSNSFTGPVNLNGGTLGLGSTNALAGGGTLFFNGGTLQFTSNNATDYSARFATNDNQAYSLDVNGQNVTLGSALTSTGGTLALTNSTGSGTLTLSTSNGYTGGTTLNGGTLAISSQSALGAGDVTFGGGTLLDTAGINLSKNFSVTSGTFANASNTASTLSGQISGGGTFNLNPSGSVTLAGDNSGFYGNLTLGSGTLFVANANALAGNGVVTLSAGTSLDNLTGSDLSIGNALTLGTNVTYLGTSNSLSQTGDLFGGNISLLGNTLITVVSNSLSLGGWINSSSGITKGGAGTLVLGGVNTLGSNGVTAGTLVMGSAQALGSGSALNLAGGVLDVAGNNLTVGALSGASGTLSNSLDNATTLTVGSGNASGTFGGTLTGSSLDLVKTGTGTQTLSGSNSYAGSTVLSNGVLSVGSANALAGGGTLSFNGGRLQFTSNNATDYSARFATNDNQAYSLDLNGQNVTLASALNSTGGTLALTNSTNTGTLTLSTSNGYTGGTTLSAGTLALANASALGTGALTINGGSLDETAGSDLTITNALNLRSFTYVGSGNLIQNTGAITLLANSTITVTSNSLTLGGNASGAFALSKAGSGTLVLAGNNTYTGATTNSAGTLLISGLLGNGSYAGVIANSGSLVFSNSATQTLSGVISGAGSLTASGTGTVILATNNTYTGITTVNSGATLQVGTGSGSVGQIGTNNVTVNSGGNLFLNYAVRNVTNAIGGAGTLTIVNPNPGLAAADGGTRLTGSNTIASVVVSGGVLVITNDFNLGASNGTLTLNGGVLGGGNSALTLQTNRAVILGSNGGYFDMQANTTMTINSSISGSGGLGVVFDGSTVGAPKLVLGGSNSYAGPTTIGSTNVYAYSASGNVSATLVLSNANALPTGNALIFGGTFNGARNAANLELNGYNATVGSISGSTNGLIRNSTGSSTLTVNINDTNATFSGNISNNVALVLRGNGTQTLSGSNSYTGGTTLNGGTVALGNSSALGSGTVTFASNATVASATNVNVTNNAVVSNGVTATYAAGAGTTLTNSGRITGTGGSVQATGSGTLALTASNSYSGGTTVNGGTLLLTTNTAAGTNTISLASTGSTLGFTNALASKIDNNITVATGTTGIIRNYGANTLELAGTLTKSGSILQFYGGAGSYNVSGRITGSAAGSDLLLSDRATVTLSGVSDYNGPTKIIGGSTLIAGISSALPSSTVLYLGTNGESSSITNSYDLNGKNQSLGGLSSAGNGVNQIYNNTGTQSLLTLAGNSTFGGSINGNVALTISGGSTVNLSGINGYTGTTTISGSSSLNLGTTGQLNNTSNVLVSAGSTLLLGSANQVNTNAAIELRGDNSKIDMGGAGNGGSRASAQKFSSLNLTGTGNSVIDFANLSGNSVLTFDSITMNGKTLSIWNWSGTAQNGNQSPLRPGTLTQLITLSKSGIDLGAITFYSNSGLESGLLGTAGFSNLPNGSFEIVPVPEPGVVIAAVMLLGWLIISNRGALLTLIRRRSA